MVLRAVHSLVVGVVTASAVVGLGDIGGGMAVRVVVAVVLVGVGALLAEPVGRFAQRRFAQRRFVQRRGATRRLRP